MFDDLITKPDVPKKFTTTDAEPDDEYRERNFTLNLLLDVENLLGNLQHEILMLAGDCMFCGAREGASHKTNCEYRTVRMRVALEIDRL